MTKLSYPLLLKDHSGYIFVSPRQLFITLKLSGCRV